MRISVYICIILLITGCSSSNKSGSSKCASYMGWFSNPANGMLVKKETEQLRYTCLLTGSYYEEMAFAGDCSQALAAIRDFKKKEGNRISFRLRLEGKDAASFGRLISRKRINEYLKESAGLFRMAAGADTINTAFCHVEENTAMAPVITFMVGFAQAAPRNEHITLLFNDPATGLNESFAYRYKDLLRTPKI